MPGESDRISDRVLIALRRIMRAVDLHSRKLVQLHGITGPQLIVLTELVASGAMTVGSLAREVSLSHATVTGILDRLERRGLIRRERSDDDKRKVFVSASTAGRAILEENPPFLQERFLSRLSELRDWEQSLILSSLQRIVAMMEAEEIEASPVLMSGPLNATTLDVQKSPTAET